MKRLAEVCDAIARAADNPAVAAAWRSAASAVRDNRVAAIRAALSGSGRVQARGGPDERTAAALRKALLLLQKLGARPTLLNATRLYIDFFSLHRTTSGGNARKEASLEARLGPPRPGEEQAMKTMNPKAAALVEELMDAARGDAEEAAALAKLSPERLSKEEAIELSYAATGHRDRSRKAALERIESWYRQQKRWRGDARRVSASVERALSRG